MDDDDSDSLAMDFDDDLEDDLDDPVTSLRSRLRHSAMNPMTSQLNRLSGVGARQSHMTLSGGIDEPIVPLQSRLSCNAMGDNEAPQMTSPTSSPLRSRLRHSPFPPRARPVSFPPAFSAPHNPLVGFRKQKLLDRTPQAPTMKPHSIHGDMAVAAQRMRKVKFADEAGKELASYFEIPDHKTISDLGALLDNVIGEIEAEYEEKFGSRVPDVVPHVETIVPRRTIFDYLRGKEDSVLKHTRRRAHSCSPDRSSVRSKIELETASPQFVSPIITRSRSRDCVMSDAADKENFPQRPSRGILKRNKPQKVKHKVETGDLFSLSQSKRKGNAQKSSAQFSQQQQQRVTTSSKHKSSSCFEDSIETSVATNQKAGFRLDSYKDSFDTMLGTEQYTSVSHLSSTGSQAGHATPPTASARQQYNTHSSTRPNAKTNVNSAQENHKATHNANIEGTSFANSSSVNRLDPSSSTGSHFDWQQGRLRSNLDHSVGSLEKKYETDTGIAQSAESGLTYTPLAENQRNESPLLIMGEGRKAFCNTNKSAPSAVDYLNAHKDILGDSNYQPVKPQPSPSFGSKALDPFALRHQHESQSAAQGHDSDNIFQHLAAQNDISSAISPIDDGDLFRPISKLFKPSLGREAIRKPPPEFTETGLIKQSSSSSKMPSPSAHNFPYPSSKIRKLHNMHVDNLPPGYHDPLLTQHRQERIHPQIIRKSKTTPHSEQHKRQNTETATHKECPSFHKTKSSSSPIREIRQVRILEKTVTIEETRYSPSVSRSNSIDEEGDPVFDNRPVMIIGQGQMPLQGHRGHGGHSGLNKKQTLRPRSESIEEEPELIKPVPVYVSVGKSSNAGSNASMQGKRNQESLDRAKPVSVEFVNSSETNVTCLDSTKEEQGSTDPTSISLYDSENNDRDAKLSNKNLVDLVSSDSCLGELKHVGITVDYKRQESITCDHPQNDDIFEPSCPFLNTLQEESPTSSDLSPEIAKPPSCQSDDNANHNISNTDSECKSNAPCDNELTCDTPPSKLEINDNDKTTMQEKQDDQHNSVILQTETIEHDNNWQQRKTNDPLSFEMCLDIFENEYNGMVVQNQGGNPPVNCKDNVSHITDKQQIDNSDQSMEMYGRTCPNNSAHKSNNKEAVSDQQITDSARDLEIAVVENAIKGEITTTKCADSSRWFSKSLENQEPAVGTTINDEGLNPSELDYQNNVVNTELRSESCSIDADVTKDSSANPGTGTVDHQDNPETTHDDSNISSMLNNNLEYDTPQISTDTFEDDTFDTDASNLKYISEDLNNFPFNVEQTEAPLEDENANVTEEQITEQAVLPSPRCSTSSVESLDAFNTSSDDMFLAQIQDTCLATNVSATAAHHDPNPLTTSPLSFDYHFCLQRNLSSNQNSPIVSVIQEASDTKPDTPEETFTLSPPLEDYYSIVPRSMSDSVSSDDISELTYVLPQPASYHDRVIRHQGSTSDEECFYPPSHGYRPLETSLETGELATLGDRDFHASIESFEDCGTVVSQGGDSDLDSNHSDRSQTNQSKGTKAIKVSDFTRVAVHECDYCVSDTDSCHGDSEESDEDEILSISIDSGSDQHLSDDDEVHSNHDDNQEAPSSPPPPPPHTLNNRDQTKYQLNQHIPYIDKTTNPSNQSIPSMDKATNSSNQSIPYIDDTSSSRSSPPRSSPPRRNREVRMRDPPPNRLKRHRRSLSSDDIVHFRHYAPGATAGIPDVMQQSIEICDGASGKSSILSLDKLHLQASKSDNRLLDYFQDEAMRGNPTGSPRSESKMATATSNPTKKRCSGVRRSMRAARICSDSEPESDGNEGETRSCCPWIRSTSHVPARTAPLPSGAAVAKHNPHTRAMRKFLDSSSNPSLVYNRRGSALVSGCVASGTSGNNSMSGYSNHGATFCDDLSLNTPCSHRDCLPKFT